ncbi:MAG: hypothetical protein J5508_08020 [Bacteroidales bacterium]|nr:hypothetical protein [Bacteroidales bacterium]
MSELSADYDRRIAEARQQSAEARQQSAEARQQSAEARKNIMHNDSIRIIQHMGKFYDTYSRSPDNVRQEEFNFMKKSAKEVIAECKKY